MSNPSILCACPFQGQFGQNTFRGIMRYAKLYTDWELHLFVTLTKPSESDFSVSDGMILAYPHQELMESTAADADCPVVSTFRYSNEISLPTVATDDYAIGQMAAEYFMEKGFRNFYFESQADCGFSQGERFRGYAEALSKPDCHVERNDPSKWIPLKNSYFDDSVIKTWKDRKFPAGVLLSHDSIHMALRKVLARSEIRLPVDVSLLGIDNDEIICEMLTPTLSSIDCDYARIGFEAARKMGMLLKGEKTDMLQLIPPSTVVERESTCMEAIEDDLGQKIVYFIQRRFNEPFKVNEMADALFISRRNLETKCRELFQKSPLELMTEQRMKHAVAFLKEKELSIEEISWRCGYKYQHHFSTTFSKIIGMSPSTYRKMHAE